MQYWCRKKLSHCQ